MKKLLSLGFALLGVSAAMAYPTLSGPTGLVAMPTADTVAAGQFGAAIDWYNTDDEATYPIRVQYGLVDGLELTAAYTLDSRATMPAAGSRLENDNALALGAKYATPWAPAGFRLAVGAQYAAQDADGTTTIAAQSTSLRTDTTATQAYLVGTRSLVADRGALVNLNGTLGVNWTKVEQESTTGAVTILPTLVAELPAPVPATANTTVSVDEEAVRLMLGFEAEFANGLRAAVEFQTKGSDIESEALSSIVVRYPVTSALTAQVGLTNAGLGVLGSDDHNLFAGVAYTFGE